jgi:hypothetical protein
MPASPLVRRQTADEAIVSPERLTVIASTLKLLTLLPVDDAIGSTLAYLLHCAYTQPDILRRVLNEPVIKQGFVGTTMLAELNRVARS